MASKGGAGVSIGTDVVYAAIHQLGGTIRPTKADALTFSIPGIGFRTVKEVTLPARPFLGLDDQDELIVESIVELFVVDGEVPSGA